MSNWNTSDCCALQEKSEVFYIFVTMKYAFILIPFIFILSACDQRSPSPLPSSYDYCHLLTGSQSIKTKSSMNLDSLMVTTKTGVYVLEHGSDAITTRANLSQNAQKTMDIQYFIFSEDNIGTISCDYMLRAACHGVSVRVIVDDLMVDTDYNYILALDQHKNIDIKIYNPNMNIGKNMAYTSIYLIVLYLRQLATSSLSNSMIYYIVSI